MADNKVEVKAAEVKAKSYKVNGPEVHINAEDGSVKVYKNTDDLSKLSATAIKELLAAGAIIEA